MWCAHFYACKLQFDELTHAEMSEFLCVNPCIFVLQLEATLTVANLCSMLEEVVEWDRLGYCLEIPSLIRSEIKKKYSNDPRCKRAMLEEWRSHHPAPSWMLVANALYGRFMSGNSGKYHKLLHLVKEKYLKGKKTNAFLTQAQFYP